MTRWRWTPERIEKLRALDADGIHRRDIARRLGASWITVSRACTELGLPERQRLWTTREVARLREMDRRCLQVREMAAELGRSEWGIRAALRKYVRCDDRRAA